jgi:methyl-accepting chemotaxis protein
MRLAVRLRLMMGGAVAVCAVAVGLLLLQVTAVSHQYEGILTGTVRQSEEARVMQVTFKKQVQEWKDILLRGSNQADLDKYTKQFHDDEKLVQDMSARLADEVNDNHIADEIAQFRGQHGELSLKYQAAYNGFVASRGVDFKTADTLVKGQDRPPTDLIDKIVADLQAQQAKVVAAQKVRVDNARLVIVTSSAALLMGVLAALYLGSRSITRPVEQASKALSQVAAGNLAVSMKGRFGGEFELIKNSVNTAVEQLNDGMTRVVEASKQIDQTARFIEAVGVQLVQSSQVTRVSLSVFEDAVLDMDHRGGHGAPAWPMDQVRESLSAMVQVCDRNVLAAQDAGRATQELGYNSEMLQRVVSSYRLRPVESAAPPRQVESAVRTRPALGTS